ncbi:hypothetical protein RJT34_23042 [Clitoria ternatea]|uniref:pectinesterase n=1 Tax=Clitoria ternatea TaxID=43366 RepID=A0AAN9IKZ9_CLITE
MEIEITLPLILFFMISYLCICRAENCEGTQVSHTIVVGHSANAEFRKVQAAIDSIPENNSQWVKIHISAGTYMEKVQIPYEKPCIFLEGEGKDVTIITYDDHQQTDTSATFSSSPDNVVATGITFKNTYNVAAMLRFQSRKMGGDDIAPALAARVYGDKSAFYECGFIGFQDTLWDVKGRHYFKNCYLEGAVDFIFGNGQSYYENCRINATASGFITAQGRQSEKEESGFVFRDGSVFGNGESLLGRAYGPYSRVIFYGTNLGSVVAPKGWDAWHYANREDYIYYAEFGCGGAGANTSNRVPWMSKLDHSELKQFSKSEFINQDAWLQKLPLKY